MRPNSSEGLTEKLATGSWGALCEDEIVDMKAGEIQAGNEEKLCHEETN